MMKHMLRCQRYPINSDKVVSRKYVFIRREGIGFLYICKAYLERNPSIEPSKMERQTS